MRWRIRRRRAGWSSSRSRPGTRAALNIRLNGAGGKTSKASQLVSTSCSTGPGLASSTNWQIAPPVSLPTSVTRRKPSVARNDSTSLAMPRGDRSASGSMPVRCEPMGQSGVKVR
jgi:hypothetical protein